VIDVNTGKNVGSSSLEETVYRNNLEAAEEIARQLRLRDIGGIIVVDFIDMVLESNRDLVLRRLVECLGRDRTKHQVAEVTSLGLVQMTRKRIGQGLLEVFSTQCEHCGGRGHVVHAEPVGIDPQPTEEPNNRRERGARRAPKPVPAAALGGKQTGKTPPPPKFDEHGHLEHEEHASHEHDAAERAAVAQAAEGVDHLEVDGPVDAADQHAGGQESRESHEGVEGHQGQESHEDSETGGAVELDTSEYPDSTEPTDPTIDVDSTYGAAAIDDADLTESPDSIASSDAAGGGDSSEQSGSSEDLDRADAV
jgi:ribonuclease E